MAPWPVAITAFLWQNALAAIPLVLIVAAICKCVPCRPSTRHFLWLLVLVLLLAPRIAPPERLTRLVTAVLPAGLEDPEPPEAVSTTRSSETVPDARLAMIPSELPDNGRPDDVRIPAAQNASSYGDAPDSALAVRRSSRPADKSLPHDRRPIQAPLRANNAAKPAPPLRDGVRVKKGRVGQDHSETTRSAACMTCPEDSVTTPSTHVAQKPKPVKPRLDADGSKPYKVVARDSGTARVKYDTSLPGVSAFQALPSPDVGDVRTMNSQAEQALGAGVPSAKHATVWDETISKLRAQWAPWLKRLAGLRSMVLALPPVPTSLWLGGVITLLLLSLRRMHRFQRVLRRGMPAGEAITAEVAKAATEVGVKRPPPTMMVQQRISPMILCGPRPKLILPVQLWSDLDRVSRRAVLCHELAHLRRRDHIVTWIEWFIGLIYWWNPLVWWVRHRLHEEAELSCDQWVTWLLPRDRRAYAVALLRAKEFVSQGHVVAPAMSMGATTQTTRKLARRIKMVMTATSRPRLSVIGMVLACALVTTAWMSGAAWACPPAAKKAKGNSGFRVPGPAPRNISDDGDAGLSTFEQHISGKKAPKTKKAPKSAKAPKARSAKRAKKTVRARSRADAAPRAWLNATASAHYTLLSGDADESHVERFEERMRRLEERLERFTERMERQLERQVERQFRYVPQVWPAPAAPQAPEAFFAPRGDGGENMWRTYRLSEGKLKELTELMVRSDVPIFVRPHDDRIDVQGTASQQRIFKAFVDMIDPPEGADAREAILRQNLATDALVQRVQMESESRAMEVRARMLEQRSEQFEQRAEELQMRAEELQSAAESLQDRLKTRALEQASGLMQEAQTLQNEAEVSGREAEELEVKAEELQERVSELRDFLDVLQDQAKRAAEQAWWAPEAVVQGELAGVADPVPPALGIAPLPALPEVAPTPALLEIGPEPADVAPLLPAAEIAPEPVDVEPKR